MTQPSARPGRSCKTKMGSCISQAHAQTSEHQQSWSSSCYIEMRVSQQLPSFSLVAFSILFHCDHMWILKLILLHFWSLRRRRLKMIYRFGFVKLFLCLTFYLLLPLVLHQQYCCMCFHRLVRCCTRFGLWARSSAVVPFGSWSFLRWWLQLNCCKFDSLRSVLANHILDPSVWALAGHWTFGGWSCGRWLQIGRWACRNSYSVGNRLNGDFVHPQLLQLRSVLSWSVLRPDGCPTCAAGRRLRQRSALESVPPPLWSASAEVVSHSSSAPSETNWRTPDKDAALSPQHSDRSLWHLEASASADPQQPLSRHSTNWVKIANMEWDS